MPDTPNDARATFPTETHVRNRYLSCKVAIAHVLATSVDAQQTSLIGIEEKQQRLDFYSGHNLYRMFRSKSYRAQAFGRIDSVHREQKSALHYLRSSRSNADLENIFLKCSAQKIQRSIVVRRVQVGMYKGDCCIGLVPDEL